MISTLFKKSTILFFLTLLWLPFCAFAQLQQLSLLKDINPGAGDGQPEGLTSFNGKLFFIASDGVHGKEPWISDGTAEGTRMIKDINPGSATSYFYTTIYLDYHFSNFFRPGPSGKLYFVANDGVHGRELWTTDGTEAGTNMVKDIATGTGANTHSNISYFMYFNNRLFFSAFPGNGTYSLWQSDGTEAGTSLVAPVNVNSKDHVILNGKLYFNGDSAGIGRELFVTDGTPQGTHKVLDGIPGPGGLKPEGLTVYGNKIIFNGDSATKGQEPWISDGTAAGTYMIKDIVPGNLSGFGRGSLPRNFILFQNKVWFAAQTDSSGEELWVTDGTSAGTYQFINLNSVARLGSSPSGLFVFQNKLWFRASSGSNFVLWNTDGSINGTNFINHYSAGAHLVTPNYFYFHSRSFSNTFGRLYKSNGTAAGTAQIPINFGGGNIDPNSLTLEIMPVGDKVFQCAKLIGGKGYELYHVETVTSIADLESAQSFELYPNPAQEWLSVKGNYKGNSIEILNILGQKVVETTTQDPIDIRFLPHGMYNLRMGGIVKKFVKD